jgi:hypothetical protein
VQRLVAAVAAVALLSMSASAALLHVHASVGHDHPEHQHGPAAHGHSTVAHSHLTDAPAPDDAARLQGCDPGEHAVSVAFTCVAPHIDHVAVPVTVETIIESPPEPSWRRVTSSDVRAHSPPRLTDAPLRAPPA